MRCDVVTRRRTNVTADGQVVCAGEGCDKERERQSVSHFRAREAIDRELGAERERNADAGIEPMAKSSGKRLAGGSAACVEQQPNHTQQRKDSTVLKSKCV